MPSKTIRVVAISVVTRPAGVATRSHPGVSVFLQIIEFHTTLFDVVEHLGSNTFNDSQKLIYL